MRESQRANWHPLVHALNGCNDQGWARLKLGARSQEIQPGLLHGVGAQPLESFSGAFPGVLAGILEWRWSSPRHESVSIWNASIAGCGLTRGATGLPAFPPVSLIFRIFEIRLS